MTRRIWIIALSILVLIAILIDLRGAMQLWRLWEARPDRHGIKMETLNVDLR